MTAWTWLRAPFPCLLTMVATAAAATQQGPTLRPAVPVQPIATIIDAFRSHSVVALGEPHGNEQAHALRLALIRDPRFAATVDDIVVEFGNARHQDLMDGSCAATISATMRFAASGRTRPRSPVFETGQSTKSFLRAVRTVNASLCRGRQLRVLLGDLPIDWDAALCVPPKPGERRLFGQPVQAP